MVMEMVGFTIASNLREREFSLRYTLCLAANEALMLDLLAAATRLCDFNALDHLKNQESCESEGYFTCCERYEPHYAISGSVPPLEPRNFFKIFIRNTKLHSAFAF